MTLKFCILNKIQCNCSANLFSDHVRIKARLKIQFLLQDLLQRIRIVKIFFKYRQIVQYNLLRRPHCHTSPKISLQTNRKIVEKSLVNIENDLLTNLDAIPICLYSFYGYRIKLKINILRSKITDHVIEGRKSWFKIIF